MKITLKISIRHFRFEKRSRRLLLLLSSGLHDGEADERHYERDDDDHEHGRDRDGIFPGQEEVLNRVRRVHKRLYQEQGHPRKGAQTRTHGKHPRERSEGAKRG